MKDGKRPEETGLNWGALDQAVGTVVRLLRNELSVRIVDVYSSFGLRYGALSTMALIEANPDCSQSEIAREVAMDDSAMVAIIDDLEARGLARRMRSTRDRRRNTLSLTSEGQRLAAQMIARAQDVEQPIHDALSEEEVKTLQQLLRRAYEAMQKSPPATA
ncbi:DNA-binding MarR family transcriptional regulator [Sphingobium sp. B11D3B]|uniref:MarR family winged helix-turn-helix transcriptional regulator n=1 Tax=Sphingobium sp. B11D3B TaxID=2940575 RepID=UPI00222610C0|nr:MarR family winged helix-turn-helix transcriptional regulator [Sphingobium sp. B11D3B]MCW2390209.1 DNA-binding MarR family transcriptional regulator [Sphingobium sp. B11D3B]